MRLSYPTYKQVSFSNSLRHCYIIFEQRSQKWIKRSVTSIMRRQLIVNSSISYRFLIYHGTNVADFGKHGNLPLNKSIRYAQLSNSDIWQTQYTTQISLWLFPHTSDWYLKQQKKCWHQHGPTEKKLPSSHEVRTMKLVVSFTVIKIISTMQIKIKHSGLDGWDGSLQDASPPHAEFVRCA